VSSSGRFIDSVGFTWQVYEVVGAPVSARFADRAEQELDGSLYFFSRGISRVLSPYPADWRDRTWGELEELLGRARAPHSRAARLAAAGSGAEAREARGA
jgi:hypothetical protein